jgi:vancomycin resistance protein VanJ
MTRLIRTLGRWSAHAATLLVAGGLTVRMTIGDTIPGLSTAFYMAPWGVLAAAAFLPVILWAKRRRWPTAAGFASVAILCTIAWVRTSFRSTPAPTTPTIRIAYWNVGRPNATLARVIDTAQSLRADIIALGESRKTGTETQPEWFARPLAKNTLPLRRGMLLTTPETARQVHDGFLNDRGQYALTETQISGRKVFVLVVDFDAIVSLSRKPAFDRLLELIAECGDVPLIVLGDFNTPSDSAYFVPFRAKLRSAFEVAGTGYAHSWPMPFPVHDLDQIWLSHHFKIARCQHGASFLSDHRAIYADVEIE